MTSASALEYRSRYELVEEARSLGVERPERMTMQELKDEILRLSVSEEEQLGARGLFGVARAMLASVVEAGLKMPDAAKVIRGDVNLDLPLRSRSPVATVTLAEIYAAQGHRSRALAVLDEVLEIEPEHEEALRIRAELISGESLVPQAEQPPKGPEPLVARLSERSVPDAPVAHTPSAESASPAAGTFGESGTNAGQAGVEVRPEFPSTEYVPVEIVETTGHEAALTPPPGPVASSEMAAERPPSAPVGEPAPGGDAPSANPILVTEQLGATLLLYWELPPEVVARSGLTESEGGPAVVVVAFTPAGPNPVRDQRTVRLAWTEPFSGSLAIPNLGPPAAVRAAVGWMVEETFLPLAVGRALERARADASAVAERAQSAFSTHRD